jgi:hypothetical protein
MNGSLEFECRLIKVLRQSDSMADMEAGSDPLRPADTLTFGMWLQSSDRPTIRQQRINE